MKKFRISLKAAGFALMVAISMMLTLFCQQPRAAEAATVTAVITDTAPTAISQGSQNDFGRFELTTSVGTANWTGIRVDISGTAVDADISKVKIYKSVDNNWSPTDLIIGQGDVVGGEVNITLSEQQIISTVATWQYFIVYVISNGANINATIGANLVSPGSDSFIIEDPDTMADTNLPFSSSLADIDEAPDELIMRGWNDVSVSIPKPPNAATRLVSMIQLKPRTESKNATWTALRVDRIGNSSSAWINSVKIYSAGAATEFDPTVDTLIGSGSVDSTITLSSTQTITTTSSDYYFVVFELNDQPAEGSTIGARIADETYVIVQAPDTVASIKNLDSKLATFVGDPHGSPGNTGAYVNTNYCSACHNTHMARQNRRILNKLFTRDPSVVNNNPASVYNALCFSCHDGTGASENIQAKYDASATVKQKGAGDGSGGDLISPGHLTDQTGTINSGYLQGTQYNPNTKLPCMICHDVHQSRNDNYAMMADELYEYSASASETTTNINATYYWDSSSTVWGSSEIDDFTRRKRCEVCHRNHVGTSDTTSTSGTGSWVDGKSVVIGIDLGRPTTHDSGAKATGWCGGCHGVHLIKVPDASSTGESSGDADCDGCHGTSFFNPMQDASSYHHYLDNAGVSNLLSSGTKYPTKNSFGSGDTTSNERRCLMCHADHDVFSPNTGGIPANGDRAKNLRASVAIVPTAGTTSSFSDTDFDADQSAGGICVSCHAISQTKNTTGQKFLSGQDNTKTLVVTKSQFAEATMAHNYEATSSFPGTGGDNSANRPFEFRANCSKCHNTMDSANYPYNAGSDTGSMQDSQFKFQLHATEVRRLLAWLNITPQDDTQDPLEESYCNRCHSLTDNPNSGSGKDYYNKAAMSASALGVKAQFSLTRNHPVGSSSSKHKAVEGESANWNPATDRHVECEDCHNPHAAQPIDANNPVRGSKNGARVSNAQKGVWGVTLSGYSTYTTGTALFTEGSTSVAGTGTSWSSSNVSAGWYIKSQYDMDGRWYKVSSVNYGAQTLTLSQSFDGARAYFDGNPNSAITIDYTATSATLTRTSSASNEYEICLKCHSKYAWDDAPPATPSLNAGGGAAKETDIGSDFNPDQLAIHPVTALGKNQPWRADQTEMTGTVNNWPLYTTGNVDVTSGGTTITAYSGSSTNWLNMAGSGKSTIVPGWLIKISGDATGGPADTGWYKVASVLSNTTMTITTGYSSSTAGNLTYKLGAGLGNAFVPPWGPWSRMVCSDCHGNSDDGGPSGPHGSAQKWILKEATTSLSFDWYNGTGIQTLTPNNVDVGASYDAVTVGLFCVNCHRRDVYGDEGLDINADNPDTTVTDNLFSRAQHDPSGNNNTYDAADVPNWGIVCMQCHGGDSLGGIHGTSRLKGRLYDDGAIVANNPDNSGTRFLNGANWIGVKRPTTDVGVTCWVKKGAGYGDTDEVNNCSVGHNAGGKTATGRTANYDY